MALLVCVDGHDAREFVFPASWWWRKANSVGCHKKIPALLPGRVGEVEGSSEDGQAAGAAGLCHDRRGMRAAASPPRWARVEIILMTVWASRESSSGQNFCSGHERIVTA